MSLKITDDMVISDHTVNVARRLNRRGGWCVSWLPERTLDREQAITAMTLADLLLAAAAGGDHAEQCSSWSVSDTSVCGW